MTTTKEARRDARECERIAAIGTNDQRGVQLYRAAVVINLIADQLDAERAQLAVMVAALRAASEWMAVIPRPSERKNYAAAHYRVGAALSTAPAAAVALAAVVKITEQIDATGLNVHELPALLARRQ